MASSSCRCFVVVFVFYLCFRLSYCVLYSTADHIVLLENDTISSVIHNSPSAWIVEFYSSFCGHCHAFAPTWKKLARMAKDWRQLIHVGAIDCAEERNLAVCVHYNIEGYPTVKFFNASASSSDLGTIFQEEKTLLNLLHEMVKVAELQKSVGLVRADVDFIPVGKEYVASFLEGRTSYDELALIFEVPTSYIGREVILDFMKCPRLGVRRVLNQNKYLVEKYSVKKFPSLIVVHRKGTFKEFSRDEKTHASFKRVLGDLCQVVKSPAELPVVSEAMRFYKTLHGKEDQRKQEAGSSAEVYMQDLESALSYMLNIEVATKQIIQGAEFSALRNFVGMLAKCFPGRPSLSEIFNNFYARLPLPRKTMFRSEYLSVVQRAQAHLKTKAESHPHPLPQKAKWVGCAGSQPHYRGYPCGLWTLFHTLTVNCGTIDHLTGLEVLLRIRRYIMHFFSCEECKKHFTAMSANLSHEVRSHNDAILWLWRSHNKVNHRLAGDNSEDPKHPKIQFPSKDLCEECRLPGSIEGGVVRWNEAVVLEFLKNHYGVDNIRIKKPPARYAPELEDTDIPFRPTNAAMSKAIIAETILTDEIDREFADYFERQLRTKDTKHKLHHDNLTTDVDPYAEII